MSKGNFGRMRAVVQNDPKGRGYSWRKRAMAALMRDSGVEPITRGARVIAYRRQGADNICAKIFYVDETQALDAIAQMQMITDDRKKPTRAYSCTYCSGWHITSREA